MATEDVHPELGEAFDASDPEQVKKREREARQRERSDREVIATLLLSPQGRNWAWRLMSTCKMFEAIPPADVATQNQLLGQRNIGLQILAQIMAASPESFIQMLREKGNA